MLNGKTMDEHHHVEWVNQHKSTISGGWFFATSLKNDGVKVSWGYDIPNRMESHKIHVPNHQPGIYSFWKTKVVLNVRHHFGHQFG